MVLNSYSKINLSLLVNSKKKNGLHQIQSYFCLINLKDRIKIKKINQNKDSLNFKGTFAKSVKKNNNSIKSLLATLRKYKLISSYYSVVIEKKIPVFGGLGGGTSNAVTVLRYILKNNPNKKILKAIEKKIGTDFKLFFYKRGFLKSLRHVVKQKINPKFFFVLIQPSIKCSTKEIYAKVKTYSKKTIFNKKKVNNRKDFINLLSSSRNDLQAVVEKKYPKIKTILNNISIQKGCSFSRITGSGSVCYGIFIKRNFAIKAFKKLKKQYPELWISFAKTV